MIKTPDILTIGNKKANVHAFPKPIRAFNGMFLEDFEVDRNWAINPRASYETTGLIFLPDRSFEYVERRSTCDIGLGQQLWFTKIGDPHAPPSVYSGTYVGLILSKTVIQEFCVNHGLWLPKSTIRERYWQFYLMVRNTTRSFQWYFAFNGNFANRCGYRVNVFQGGWIRLDRFVNNVHTILAEYVIGSGDMTWDWKLFRVTDNKGRIQVYHEELGTIIDVVDKTYRNLPCWGMSTYAQAFDWELAWIDNLAVG